MRIQRQYYSGAIAGGNMVIALIITLLALQTVHAEKVEGEIIKLRIAAYNVACGQWATPEQIAEALKPLDLDLLFLNEVPKANVEKKVEDWSSRVAEKLGLQHVYVGSNSSSNHKAPRWGDITGNYGGKFKSVLSRTPLTGGKDYILQGKGWAPAGVVRVETKIGGRKFALYSLHLPGRTEDWSKSKQKRLAELIAKEDSSFEVIAGGDFNEVTEGDIMHNLLLTGNLKDAIPTTTHEFTRYCSKHGLFLTVVDHILYRVTTPIKVLKTKMDWGPKKETKGNEKNKGHLSDHPWVWCELEIPAKSSSK